MAKRPTVRTMKPGPTEHHQPRGRWSDSGDPSSGAQISLQMSSRWRWVKWQVISVNPSPVVGR
jgi:hypothetical protein